MKVDAVVGDVLGGEVEEGSAVGAGAAVEDQMGVGDGGEEVGPEVLSGWRDFGGVVEAAEGDAAGGFGGEGGDVRGVIAVGW